MSQIDGYSPLCRYEKKKKKKKKKNIYEVCVHDIHVYKQL